MALNSLQRFRQTTRGSRAADRAAWSAGTGLVALLLCGVGGCQPEDLVASPSHSSLYRHDGVDHIVSIPVQVLTTPDLVEDSENWFGRDISAFPDVDGDGDTELLVSLYRFDVDAGLLYRGGPQLFGSTPDVRFEGGSPDGVVVVSDLDGDLCPEAIIPHGGAGVHCADPVGEVSHPWLELPEPPDPGSSLVTGYSGVVVLGDNDSDGFVEIAMSNVGADGPDGAESSGTVSLFEEDPVEGLAYRSQWIGDAGSYSFFGWNMVSVDVNGDALQDFVTSSGGWPESDEELGRVQVFLGEAGGYSPTPTWEMTGTEYLDEFGERLVKLGDVNGDGREDVVVSSRLDGPGRVDVLLGAPGGFEPDPWWSAEGRVGAGVTILAGPADFDDDGRPDFVAAGSFPPDPEITVFRGVEGGFEVIRMETVGVLEDEGLLSTALAVGDFNGDGFSDVAHAVSASSGLGHIAIHIGSPEDADDDGYTWDVDCDDNDALVTTPTLWAPDLDSDGYTGPGTVSECFPPSGYASKSDEPDCDDGDPEVWPGAPDPSGDGVDQDCDGCDGRCAEDSKRRSSQGGCGCSSVQSGTAAGALLPLAALFVRRRR